MARTEPWRIATVWIFNAMFAQKCLNGVYRHALGTGDVVLRQFNAAAPDFGSEVIQPLRKWKPHGVIVHMADVKRLEQLRKSFAGIPFVSAISAPTGLVNTFVCADGNEILTLARDYFYKCGLSAVALFTAADPCFVERALAMFGTAVPNGPAVILPRDVAISPTPAMARQRKKIMAAELSKLPKPLGMITMETSSAAFLLGSCLENGLRVPQDVQIIGVDDEDRCMMKWPHLTSIRVPGERFGEESLEAMLRLLRREQPPPPAVIRVTGASVVPRGSTALLSVGQPAVAAALDLMRAHAGNSMTASRVADLLKVGRTTFYREFSRVTGETPAQYLRRLRLDVGCAMLRDTDATIEAVAEGCGFADASAFRHFFRRHMGMAPSAYRERLTQ